MALWNYEQRERLAAEEKIISQELPHFWFSDRIEAGKTTLRGEHITHKNKSYTLCVRIPSGYPFDLPSLYVISPCPLYNRSGKPMTSYGLSHSMHLRSPDWGNYTKICHWKEDCWSASNTLMGVIFKGFSWLECYELYLQKGGSIDDHSSGWS